MKDACIKQEQDILNKDGAIDVLQQTLHECELNLARSMEQLSIIRRDCERSAEKALAFEAERTQISENIADIHRERSEADSEHDSVEQGAAATREDVSSAQMTLLALRSTREQLSAELTELKVRRMALSKERDAVFSEQQRLSGEQSEIEARLKRLSEEYSANKSGEDEINKTLEQMKGNIEAEQKEADDKKGTQRVTEEERNSLSESLSELRANREELLSSDRDLAERLHKQELQKNRSELEFTNLQDHIWNEYELTYENALPLRHDIAIGSTNARISAIKTEMRALGDVNLGAIEDYKVVLERHTALSTQCDDLRKAQTDLGILIAELTDTMQAEFLRQFMQVQNNFSKIFAELFGGGYAELRLADKNDVLGCDIDIIAQPPGKKLQLLSLLSGGERAFTAIALLFALLTLKPPAFCVLDEIESSLDEVNVSRFADYIRDYSEETQFILITHRKGSMEVCDTLYGVSMEEKGISKIVSARFGEAVS